MKEHIRIRHPKNVTSSIWCFPIFDVLVKRISLKPFVSICEQIPNYNIYIFIRSHRNCSTIVCRSGFGLFRLIVAWSLGAWYRLLIIRICRDDFLEVHHHFYLRFLLTHFSPQYNMERHSLYRRRVF